MDYERMWNTLKAESGYRETISSATVALGINANSTLKELMEHIEKRAALEDSEDEQSNKEA